MDTYKQVPERIISGSFHLIWIVLLIFVLLGINPTEVAEYIKTISGGLAALIASITIGASFFLGNLFDRAISEAVRIYMELRSISPKPILELKMKQIKCSSDELLELVNNYKDKAFFRSVSMAGLVIILLLLYWNLEYVFSGVGLSIIVVGLILESMSIRIFFVLRKKYAELYDRLITQK